MFNHDEELFKLHRDLDYWRKHNHERTPLFAGDDLGDGCLDDLGASEEAVEVV